MSALSLSISHAEVYYYNACELFKYSYKSNLVHTLLHLVSFNIALAIFSTYLDQKYGVHVGLV